MRGAGAPVSRIRYANTGYVARLRQTLGGRYGGRLTHRSYTTTWDTTHL